MKAEAGAQLFRINAPTDLAMAQVGLVDAPAPDGLSQLVRLAAELIGAPVALVSVVQPALDRQFLSATHGLRSPMREARQTSLAYSFCKHVHARGTPLIVNNSRESPLVCDNPGIVEFDVAAYLGVPISWPDGTVIGALCVFDGVPRGWTAMDVKRMELLSRCVDDQIRLLLALHHERKALGRAELAALARDLMFREVNHELRTPLNGVVGIAEVLAETDLDTEQRWFVDLLIDSADQLTHIVEDIAVVTSKLTEPGEGSAEDFDPTAVITEVIALLPHHSGPCLLQRRKDDAPIRNRHGNKLLLRQVLYDALRTATSMWPSAAIDISLDDCAADLLGITLRSRPVEDGAVLSVLRSSRALAPELCLARRLARAAGGSLRVEVGHVGATEAVMVLRLPFAEASSHTNLRSTVI